MEQAQGGSEAGGAGSLAGGSPGKDGIFPGAGSFQENLPLEHSHLPSSPSSTKLLVSWQQCRHPLLFPPTPGCKPLWRGGCAEGYCTSKSQVSAGAGGLQVSTHCTRQHHCCIALGCPSLPFSPALVPLVIMWKVHSVSSPPVATLF